MTSQARMVSINDSEKLLIFLIIINLLILQVEYPLAFVFVSLLVFGDPKSIAAGKLSRVSLPLLGLLGGVGSDHVDDLPT